MAGETAPPPVAPTIAAQKLRLYSRGVYAVLSTITSGGAASLGAKKNAKMYYEASLTNATTVDQWIEKVREAGKTRKASAVSEALDSLGMYLRRERRQAREAYTFLYTATGGSLSEETRLKLVSDAKMIVDLVQSLPTSEDMPSGNMENMLRAIMAILRTGGFPGAEGLKWEEVKKHAETKSENGAAAAAEESGAASGAGDGGASEAGEYVAGTIILDIGSSASTW